MFRHSPPKIFWYEFLLSNLEKHSCFKRQFELVKTSKLYLSSTQFVKEGCFYYDSSAMSITHMPVVEQVRVNDGWASTNFIEEYQLPLIHSAC